MKKLALLFVVVMMLAAMSVTSFASGATFATVTVDEGTTTASAVYTLSFDEGSNIGMLQINLVLPDGITLTDVDFSEFTALCGTITNDNAFDIGQLLIYDDDMDVPVSGDINLTFKFALDASLAVGTYDIAIDDVSTMAIDPEGNPLIDSFPGTTITVAGAPDPDPVKVPGEAVTAKTTLETAEAKFENVAIYEIKWPVSAGEYGISLNGVDKDITPGVAITGSGNVEYVLAFYNITDASVLEVIPYTYQ